MWILELFRDWGGHIFSICGIIENTAKKTTGE